MGTVVAQGSTAWNAADAATTTYAIDLSGSGFSAGQPLKALIVFANAQSSSTDATASADIQLSFGVATGTAARGCVSVQSDDAAGAGNASRVTRSDCVVTLITTADADDGRLDLSAFTDTGFTFIVDVATSANRRVHWIALGGSDFSVATAGTFTFTADTATTQNVTVTGFAASPSVSDQCVMVLYADPTTGSIGADATISIGAAAGTSPTNYVSALRMEDPADPTDTSSYSLAGEISATVQASQAVATRSSISAWGTNLFTFNRIEADAVDRLYVYLAMKGPLFAVGDFTIPTNTTPFSETVSGVSPKGALFFSCGRAASTADAASVGAELSIGAAASVADQQCVSIYDEDNIATTDCDHSVQYGDVVAVWTAGGGTLDATVALDSFDSGGMTLHCTDAAGAGSKFVWYLAVGAVSAEYTGSSAGTGTPTGTLTARASYVGSSAGTGTASGALNGATAYAGTSAGVATCSGALGAAASLAGTCAGVGAASGTMTALASYVGASAGLGTPTAALTALADYACTSAGIATCSATLNNAASYSGAASGTCVAAGQMEENSAATMLPRPRLKNLRRHAAEYLAKRRH